MFKNLTGKKVFLNIFFFTLLVISSFLAAAIIALFNIHSWFLHALFCMVSGFAIGLFWRGVQDRVEKHMKKDEQA